MLLNGRVAGISGIVGGLIVPRRRETDWRLAFVAGLLTAPLAMGFYPLAPRIDASFGLLVVAGLLGRDRHELRLGLYQRPRCLRAIAPFARSLVATVAFMSAGIITVFVVRHSA